jgi:hypothetical protein
MAAEKTWCDYARRLSSMSAHEIYTRSRQALSRRADVWFRSTTPDAFDASSKRSVFCEIADVPKIIGILRRRIPLQVERILTRADRALHGKFDLLGYTGLDFGKDIDWGLDPVHGKRAPFVPWPSVRYLDFAVVGDRKVPGN